MKKVVNPLPTGGAPIFGTELIAEVVSQETWDAVESILRGVDWGKFRNKLNGVNNPNLVLSGGVITTGNVTAGIAYFPNVDNGVIARFPSSATISGAFNIHLEAELIEQKPFFDGPNKDYFTTRTCTIVNGAGTNNDETISDLTDADAFIPTIEMLHTAPLGNIRQATAPLPVWNMDTVSAVTVARTAFNPVPPVSYLITGGSVVVSNDLTIDYYPIEYSGAAGNPAGYWWRTGVGDLITVGRHATEFFDSANFSALGTSRGYVTITFVDPSPIT